MAGAEDGTAITIEYFAGLLAYRYGIESSPGRHGYGDLLYWDFTLDHDDGRTAFATLSYSSPNDPVTRSTMDHLCARFRIRLGDVLGTPQDFDFP